jgi:hypothetical protein
MNFFSHKIANPTGNTQSWDEWLDDHLKEASEAKPECEDDPRGQCRGQVINNDNEEGAHSYQEGESVDGKPDQVEGGSKKESEVSNTTKVVEADCGKDMGECDAAGKVTEEHTDAGNADVGNASVEQNINNDPCYQKGESTNPGKVDGKNKKTEASSKAGFKKIACLNRREKLELFAAMTERKTKSGAPAYPIKYIEAMVGVTYANMKDDEKEWFRKFWLTMYPESYVSEMVADR